MASNAQFAEVAALAGDPARACMLHALLDGRALTATELARVAGIAPQTASGHLTQMTALGMLTVEKQGRHRYHRLATASVAHMLESIMQVAAELEPNRKRFVVGPRDAALRKARTCYDHFAGRLGVALADALIMPTLAGNPCGMPVHTSSRASTPAATARSTYRRESSSSTSSSPT